MLTLELTGSLTSFQQKSKILSSVYARNPACPNVYERLGGRAVMSYVAGRLKEHRKPFNKCRSGGTAVVLVLRN
jgi:hypothetical protein